MSLIDFTSTSSARISTQEFCVRKSHEEILRMKFCSRNSVDKFCVRKSVNEILQMKTLLLKQKLCV